MDETLCSAGETGGRMTNTACRQARAQKETGISRSQMWEKVWFFSEDPTWSCKNHNNPESHWKLLNGEQSEAGDFHWHSKWSGNYFPNHFFLSSLNVETSAVSWHCMKMTYGFRLSPNGTEFGMQFASLWAHAKTKMQKDILCSSDWHKFSLTAYWKMTVSAWVSQRHFWDSNWLFFILDSAKCSFKLITANMETSVILPACIVPHRGQ